MKWMLLVLLGVAPQESEPSRFWSFQPPREPELPEVKGVGHPIDRFILARGLTPAPAADARTLIRRATFDLIGLPPDPEEVEAFVADSSPDAFARVVDRLLASPHYGERWGRHWLDVVRYADTAGETADYPVPQAYRYRNYVIRAFNEDRPYDVFLREQIAGDLLPSADDAQKYERIVATGYIAIARRFGFDPDKSYHHLAIDDTIETLGRSVLGLGLGCARCHDHKFDPISSEDYTALYGIFAGTRYPFPGSEDTKRPRDFVPLVPASEVEALLKPFKDRQAELEAEVKRLETEKAPAAAVTEAKKKRDAHAAKPPVIPDAYAVAEGTPQNAKVHKRGDPRELGKEVPRRFLKILGGQELPADAAGSGRMQLAEWLVDSRNPLTARVMVNRIWQRHFGKGLVRTPNDFGRQGKAPTHPELLDYLALRFMENKWSIKSMHRLIMLSRTYRQSGLGDSGNAKTDPENELLWRFDRRRLDAEELRDALLAVGGALDRTMGGEHPFPARHTWGYTQHNAFTAVYESNRRSVYVMQQRLKRHPFFATFDGADTNASTAERQASMTPLQALFMMNDKFVHAQADRFAARLRGTAEEDVRRIDLAHRLALGRPAWPDEIALAVSYLKRYGEAPQAWASYARALFASNEFIFVE